MSTEDPALFETTRPGDGRRVAKPHQCHPPPNLKFSGLAALEEGLPTVSGPRIDHRIPFPTVDFQLQASREPGRLRGGVHFGLVLYPSEI